MLIVAKILQLRFKAVLALFLIVQGAVVAQDSSVSEPLDGREGRELLLKNFRPRMQLKVAENWFQLLFLNYLAEVKVVENKQFHTK